MTVTVGVNILAMTLLVNDDIFEQIPSSQGVSHWLFTFISAPHSQLLLSLVLVLILLYYYYYYYYYCYYCSTTSTTTASTSRY